MSTTSATLSNLRTYTGFARRYARKFLDDRRAERGIEIASAPHRPDPSAWSDNRLTLAWLGHATVLMNFYGTWLLTDPALALRVGVRVGVPPLLGTTLGPRRLVRPALSARELPRLDAVLISHAHMDHCDLTTLRQLPRETHAVVQHGNSDLVRRFRHVTELKWGESVTTTGSNGGARIESIEAKHWGARTLTDSHRGYGGFLIEKQGRTVLFAGDTAYTPAYARLRETKQIDLAVLPIGAYDPYIHVHASPEQAWQMRGEMNARYMLPIHHATFRLSREPVDEPITRLLSAANNEQWRVCLTQVGQTWELPEGMRSN